MTVEQWDSVKAHYFRAVGLSQPELESFLTELTLTPEVVTFLRQLLEQTGSVGPRITNPCWMRGSSPAIERLFRIGEILSGRFEIASFLGAGGAGEVYRAFDHTQGVFVALKALHKGTASSSGGLNMLKRELNTARLISHPGVCRLHDVHWPDTGSGHPFITMELVEGQTLSQIIHANGPWTVEAATPIVRQILDALIGAHERNVVHRDLKSGNVMLCASGSRVVIMDFGLARQLRNGTWLSSSTDAPPSTATAFAGTPAFMAPELLSGGSPNFSSDIYAFGVIVFEMLTGRLPFEGATPLEIASRRLHEEAPSPRRYVPKLDPRWNHAISVCLSRQPDRRPKSFREVRDLFETAPPVFRTRRRVLIAFGIAAVPCAATLALWALGQFAPPVQTLALYDLDNPAHDPSLAGLSAGISSEILRRLSQLRWLSVIPMRSARPSAGLPNEAALSLAGFVQWNNGDYSLKFQLTRKSQSFPVWEASFPSSRWPNNVALQNEICRQVAQGIQRVSWQSRLSLPPHMFQPARPDNTPTSSSAALDCFMRASHLLQEQSAESTRVAIENLERAVSLDPRFALAFASLAEAYLSMQNFGVRDPRYPSLARNYAERAVREESSLAEAHAVLGAVRQQDWDWTGAESSYNEALRLKPSFARAYRWRAGLILQFARTQETLADIRKAIALDPYDRSAVTSNGLCLLFAGQPKAAAAYLSSQIADRDLPAARYNLSQAYSRLGQLSQGNSAESYFAQALEQAATIERIERRSPSDRSELSTKAYAIAYATQGNVSAAEPYLRRLEALVDAGQSNPGSLAMIYSPLNRLDQAFDAIGRAVALRDRFVFLLRVNVFLDNIRQDPRLDQFLNYLHLK